MWFRTTARVGEGLERLEARPVAGVLAGVVPIQAYWVVYFLGRLGPGERPPLLDSVIFEYVGWYLSTGARLYVDVYEVKPPLAFEVPAAVALVTGGGLGYHAALVVLTAAAAVGAAGVATAIVHRTTGDGIAAVAAGLGLYVLPAYGWRAAVGYKAKYFVLLAGLAAVYLALRDRPAGAGAAAAAAAGFWQLGVAFPGLALGMLFGRGHRAGLGRAVAAMAGVWTAMLLPVVAWGGLGAMVVETVLTQVLVAEAGTALDRLSFLGYLLGLTLPVALLGGYGLVRAVLADPRRRWWAAAGAVWFLAAIALLDLDYTPDVFVLFGFLAVGLGWLAAEVGRGSRPVAVVVALLVLLSVPTAHGFGLGASPVPEVPAADVDADRAVTVPYSPAEQVHLFWTAQPPETCRVFAGPMHREWVRLTGQRLNDARCGALGPALRALGDRLP